MQKAMQIVDVVAFVILLLGGLNFLIYGLFGYNFMAMLFGAVPGVFGRIVYALIGIAALLLLITVIARAVRNSRRHV